MTVMDTPSLPIGSTQVRAEEILANWRLAIAQGTDRIFLVLLGLEWLVGVVVALYVSPSFWDGRSSFVHVHVWAAAGLGGLIVLLPMAMILAQSGMVTTRYVVAVAQMLMGALLIHLTGGRIETHFHVFGSLAFLAVYRDWRVIVLASAVVTADHFFRGVLFSKSIFGFQGAEQWRWAEHAAWVVFEAVVLIYACRESSRELAERSAQQAEIEAIRDEFEHSVGERTSDLVSANADLAGQVAERQRAEDATRESSALLTAVMEGLTEALFVKDLDGRYILVNDAGAAYFGHEVTAILGRTDAELFAPNLAGQSIEEDRRVLATGRAEPTERAWVFEGRAYSYQVTKSVFRNAAGRPAGIVAVAHDISDRQRARCREEAQHACVRIHATAKSIDEAIPQLIAAIGTKLGFDGGEYWRLDPGAEFLRRDDDWWTTPNLRDGFGEASRGLTFSRGQGLVGRVWLSGAASWIPDLRGDPGFRRLHLADAVGLRSAVGFPITGGAGTIGVMCFFLRDSLDIDSSMLQTFETIGRQIGLFADRRRSEEERARLATIVEASEDFIGVADASGRVLWRNAAYCRFLGIPLEQAVNRPLDSSYPDWAAHLIREEGMPAAARGGSWLAETALLTRDGREVPVSQLVVAHRGDDGQVAYYATILRDISAQKRAEAELRRAKEVAETASRTKSEFLANMSHEIRTPMNGILGMTELTLDTDLTDHQREYLGLVKVSAESLLTVINDILDFSKIEAGKLEIDSAPFALREAMEETLKSLALRAHGKGVELACRIAPDVPNELIGDTTRLRQVVVNLVGNAIKFTEAGEVCVSVEVEPVPGAESGAVGLRISVADTGIGIPIEKLAAIFAPFEQADNSTTRRYGGTGLGLAISQRLVDLMGGRIWVESRPGHGSTFHFTARLAIDPVGSTGLPGGTRSRAQLDGLPVLIVDDNETNRRILLELLGNWGARPVAVADGPSAIEALGQAARDGEPYPVALIDGMMPGMDGFELASRLRGEPTLAGLRLLMLTSAGLPDDAGSVRALGIAACLTKPLRQSELFNTLVATLESPGDGPVVSAQGRGEPGPAKADDVPETSPGLSILLVEDHLVNQKVATRLLEDLGHAVTVVGDGRRALEAIAARTFDLVLMDIQMPVMDGFEATASIRADEATTGRHLPIIALTAHAMKGDRERCLTAGFDLYLSKPIRRNELTAALEQIVATSRVPPPAKSGVAAEHAKAPVPAPHEAMRAHLGEVCGDDPEFVRELVTSVLDSAPRSLDRIEEALSIGDLDRAAREAHGLVGVCLTLGADALALSSRDVERAARGADLDAARLSAVSARSHWDGLRPGLVEMALPHEALA